MSHSQVHFTQRRQDKEATFLTFKIKSTMGTMGTFYLTRNILIMWALNKVQIIMCNYMIITLDVIIIPVQLW